MTGEQINQLREIYLKIVEDANKAIEHLQDVCSHSEEKEVTWSWRVAVYDQAYVCVHCGKFLRYKVMMDQDLLITNT